MTQHNNNILLQTFSQNKTKWIHNKMGNKQKNQTHRNSTNIRDKRFNNFYE